MSRKAESKTFLRTIHCHYCTIMNNYLVAKLAHLCDEKMVINNFLQIVSKISPMWFALYLNLICNLCSCYLKKKKKFTSVVCSCLAFRDLLTESITIDEYLFSLSPSKFNCNAFLRSILQNKAQTKFHSFTYQRVWKQ